MQHDIDAQMRLLEEATEQEAIEARNEGNERVARTLEIAVAEMARERIERVRDRVLCAGRVA